MAQKVWTDEVLTASDVNTYLTGEGGAWTSYTPTLVQSATVASAWSWSRYARFGRLIIWTFGGNATAAGTSGSAITVTLPVTAAPSVNVPIGSGFINDASVDQYQGSWKMASTTTINLVISGETSAVGSAPSFALANLDTVEGFVVYEASA